MLACGDGDLTEAATPDLEPICVGEKPQRPVIG